jgi:hypothetical protein
MKIQNLRFQKLDKYQNPVFIASRDDSNYTLLADLAKRLREKNYDTFLPIYSSVEFNYATIRFTKNTKYTLIPGAKYDVEFKVRTVARDERVFVNCLASVMRMTEKPAEIDYGQELEF